MATTVRSTVDSTSSGSTTPSTTPTSQTTGDVLVIVIHANSNPITIVQETTQAASYPLTVDTASTGQVSHSVAVFSRRIVDGDPATWNFTLGSSQRWEVNAQLYQNPHATTIYDVAPTVSLQGSQVGTVDAPTITTLTDNAIHAGVVCADGVTLNWQTSPSGYTVDVPTTALPANSGQQSIAWGHKVITPAGATGAKTWTFNTTTGVFGVSFAIKDVGAGGGVVRTVGPSGRDYTTVQAAINAAGAGDIIKCDANVTFSEQLTLPNKGVLGSMITITSNTAASNMPAAGVRISPSYAAYMPKIQSTGGGVTTVQVAPGANHYTFQWVEFPEVPQGFNAILTIGSTDGTVQQYKTDEPDHITIDQCWIHGGAVCGQKRGIQADGRYITISNNYFSDIKSVGQDCQCVAGQNGHGPLTVTNNYMSGGTEIFILGGGDPGVRTSMTVTGTPTTTSAAVSCSDSGHTLAELATGQAIGVKVSGVWRFTTISTITGSGATGTLTFPALPAAPDVPGGIKAGVVLGMEGASFGLTFQKNYCRNHPDWFEGVFTKPTGLAITGNSTASGTLAAGAHYYTVQVFSTHGYQGATVNSAESLEVSDSLSAPGTLTLSWNAKSGADFYRLWHGTSAGNRTSYVDITGATTYADAGAAKTTATPGSATRHQIKNLFELKAVQHAQIDSCIFEYHWRGVDNGKAIWLKSVNQDGNGVFIQSRDITFEKNIVRHCDGFLVVNGIETGSGGYGNPGPLTNLTVQNILAYDMGDAWGEGVDTYAMNIANGAVNVTINHCTLPHRTTGGGGGLLSVDSTAPLMVNLVLTNSMLRAETYDFHDSSATGDAALTAACTSHTNSKNAIADGSTRLGLLNLYESLALWKGEFVSYADDGAGADFTIKSTSAYHNAGLDGKDIGADIAAVLAATVDVVSGVPSGGTFGALLGLAVNRLVLAT